MRALAAFALLLTLAACDSSEPEPESGVANAQSRVTVAYEGRLTNGTVFDRSDRATFPLQNVIPGFRDGIVGMRIGESKTITVAPEDGYRDRPQIDNAGNVIIPANSTLIFDVTLLDIQ